MIIHNSCFIGGRSGAGKSTVASEMHAELSAAGIAHCVIEGDNLDLAYPPPWEHGLAEKNLAAIWANYLTLGVGSVVLHGLDPVQRGPLALVCFAGRDDLPVAGYQVEVVFAAGPL